MSPVDRYDAIVIGAGQSGGPLSTALARSGRRTALIEREHVGGTCINEGCTPTKTMVASARVAYLARRAADYGVGTGPIAIDMTRVRERKRAIVNSFRSGSQRRVETTKGLDLIWAEARFTGPKQVTVDDRVLEAELFFINAGCRPAAPDIEGLDRVPSLDSTSVMELDIVPEHLLVLGGGYIGLEFGQMFRRFGSRVTIVQRGRQLLPLEDGDVAEAVQGVLVQDGIDVLLETEAVRAESSGGGIRLTIRTPAGERSLEGSHVLRAAGRVPTTECLGLSEAGIAMDAKGFVVVNERLETSVPGVYAMGDIKGGPAFTHISYDDYRVIRTNLLQGGRACITDRLVPYAVFIDPQLGRIGLSERDAKRLGKAVRVARLPMTSVARALELDESRGFMKALVDPESGQILGAAVLGIEGGELMSALQLAMMGGVPYGRMRDAVFAHPTLAESLNNLFSSLDA